MKYIVIVADGMADLPLKELQDRTPLEVAKKTNIISLLEKGKLGRLKTIPSGMTPASDVANLSVLGYDPKVYYTGRGPLEAVNIGVKLKKDDVAFRCNLITEGNGILIDYSAGHITSKEAKVLINFLNQKLGSKFLKFYHGTSYRNLAVISRGTEGVQCVPPHDIIGKEIERYLPKAEGSNFLIRIMKDSRKVLINHQINKVRIDLKENPANMIWFWGQGKLPKLPSFKEKFNLDGAVISAVDLINGLGRIIGFFPITVPTATGYYDTDYNAKAKYAIKALKEKDFIYIHVEAPDEAGHNADLREKITAFERIDRLIVGNLIKALEKQQEKYRFLILADHPTPISLRTHTNKPVWFVVSGEGISSDGFNELSEKKARDSKLFYRQGHKLMDDFILKRHY